MVLCSCGKEYDNYFFNICQECEDVLEKQEEQERVDKFNNTLLNLEANASANPFVYLVYFVDLDGDCLKKSEITQVGLFSNKDTALYIAEKVRNENEGYSDDCRCHYVHVMKVKVDGRPCMSYHGEPIGETIYYQ